MCLGPIKQVVKEGEFQGVELAFMGLNNQNLHNFLFRGFLRPWEAYTGAKITWIDLAQADYNPRLQQAIATGTVDFDIVEMGAPFEGDVDRWNNSLTRHFAPFEDRSRPRGVLEDATEKSAVTPGPIAPARELLGEMLLEMKQPAEALKEFQAT